MASVFFFYFYATPVNKLHKDSSSLKCQAVSTSKELPVHKSVTSQEDGPYQHSCEDVKSGNLLLLRYLCANKPFIQS